MATLYDEFTTAAKPTYRTRRPYGVRQVFRAKAYEAKNPGAAVVTCGGCGRSWDDNHVTGVTPAPAALCPFCNA